MSFIKSSIIIVACIILLNACSTKTIIQTQEVLIPTKCKQVVPKRPTRKQNISRNIIDLLEYTEKLEKLVEACVYDLSKDNQTENTETETK